MHSGVWYAYPFWACWVLWLLYWRISASRVKQTQWQESPLSRASHVLPLLLGVYLTVQPSLPGGLSWQLLPQGAVPYLTGVVLLVLGLGFSCWARVTLGSNWSSTVTVKSGHELIRTGPYRWVRHPIYTGMLTAFVGGAIAQGALHSFLGVALITAAFIRKLSIEERVMTTHFPQDYPRYRREVAALLPGIY